MKLLGISIAVGFAITYLSLLIGIVTQGAWFRGVFGSSFSEFCLDFSMWAILAVPTIMGMPVPLGSLEIASTVARHPWLSTAIINIVIIFFSLTVKRRIQKFLISRRTRQVGDGNPIPLRVD